MTVRRRSRRALLDALLAEEETLSDLRAALVALSLIASAAEGIEKDDLVGLRFVTRAARDLADAIHRSWQDAVRRLVKGGHPGR